MNINAHDFLENFEIGKGVVGIVGYGYVGQAVEAFFSSECLTRVYDKHKTDITDTLEDVVTNSDVIFVCVPTPMNEDGSCHTGIVDDVLSDITRIAKNVSRDLNDFVVTLKSTVPPGFTDDMRKKHSLRLVFSPEFLTEKSSIEDFENSSRIVLGGPLDDTRVVYKFFERKLGHIPIVSTEATVAEMVKLFTNAFLATKVLFGNEIYKVCEKLGVSYDEVWVLACLDPRITSSHLNVPGHDGDFGFGGHCFFKDVNNLRFVANKLNTGEKLFSSVLERNNEIRTDRDWERMVGRAVISNKKE